MYEIPRLTSPQLVRCGADWVVDVPAGRVAESVAFAKDNGCSGYKVNAFSGATQETIDDLLSMADPRILVVAGDLAVNDIGSGLRKLALGIRTPWPESLPQSEVEDFTSMTIRSTNLLPRQVRQLSLFGFDAADLSPLQVFRHLEAIRLTEANNLASLDGLPMTLTHVDIVRCRKLKDIAALRHSSVRHFSAQMCPLLSKAAIEQTLAVIQHRKDSA